MSSVRSAAAPTGRERLAWEWKATGTVWRLHHDGCVDAPAAAAAAAAVEEDEARWSRFRGASEITRINDGAGSPVPVSAPTLELLAECAAWRERTGGVFDPLVGGPLTAWGYASGMQHCAPFAERSPCGAGVTGAVELDVRRRRVTIPRGASLDLGGIAKGWIADRLALLLAALCPGGAILVDAGGDLVAARGSHLVAVAGESPVRIELTEGSAIATSGWALRSWRNGDGRLAHHLIDPATGAPARRSQATVVADSATAADVLAKTIAIRPDRLASLGLPARVLVDGTVAQTAAWTSIARPAAA